jgi:hypothetical protein
MANPVAIYATSIDPPSRRLGAVDPDSARSTARASRAVGAAYPRLVYDARQDPNLERLRHAEALRDIRPRARGADPVRDDDRFLAAQDDGEFLRETGRRKASSALSFLAQQIAQEKLSPGAHFEEYKPVTAAYDRAARHSEPAAPPGSTLHMLV